MILVWLFVVAFFEPPGIRRALVLFIVTYCTLASFTEDAFTNVSTYLLALTVAASLLVMPVMRQEDSMGGRNRPATVGDKVLA